MTTESPAVFVAVYRDYRLGTPEPADMITVHSSATSAKTWIVRRMREHANTLGPVVPGGMGMDPELAERYAKEAAEFERFDWAVGVQIEGEMRAWISESGEPIMSLDA